MTVRQRRKGRQGRKRKSRIHNETEKEGGREQSEAGITTDTDRQTDRVRLRMTKEQISKAERERELGSG